MPARSPNPNLARRRRLIAFALISAVLAAIAVLNSLFSIGLLPPSIEARPLQGGAAVTHALVRQAPTEHSSTASAFETRARRANLIGELIASPPVLDRIASAMDIDPSQIEATTDVSVSVPAAFVEPDNERRANEVLTSGDPYKLDIQARTEVPVLDVYAQAPTAAEATKLADTAVAAANAYLGQVARGHGDVGLAPVTLTQFEPARGGTLDPTAPMMIAALTFLVVFAISFGLLFLLAQVRRGWLRAGAAGDSAPAPKPKREAPIARQLGDWPHTTRVLPWMVAAFIAILWLLPINAITLQASLPVELKLDRLALPIVVVTWLLSLAVGGRGAPRWRFTKVHGVVAAFVAVAFLSVVLNAANLDQTLELELAIKKLTLLAAFFTTFLLVASVVRPSEVRPFMTLTLALAVICALGVIWEYRFQVNLFYEWSATLLPGIFHVSPPATGAFDEIGRPAVIGPADLGLEAVAMLSMALPIAFVRLMHSERGSERLLYGLAICIVFGAMVSTYRKSALLAPVAICVVLAYFRRRELLRLAPLGVVVLVALPILAPSALSSVVDQFAPSHLHVATVDDRVSDYDAIRPDLLSHPAFGRGYGTYEHTSYRILDNDLLMRVVETGIVGLAAFVLMLVMLIVFAAPIIRGRDPSRAPPALAIAAAAGAFLVLSELFDIMSFPHTPYILMTLAGLLAVIVGASEERAPSRRPRLADREPAVDRPPPVVEPSLAGYPQELAHR